MTNPSDPQTAMLPRRDLWFRNRWLIAAGGFLLGALLASGVFALASGPGAGGVPAAQRQTARHPGAAKAGTSTVGTAAVVARSEEHTSELQSQR